LLIRIPHNKQNGGCMAYPETRSMTGWRCGKSDGPIIPVLKSGDHKGFFLL
jgi:hypothetical protein